MSCLHVPIDRTFEPNNSELEYVADFLRHCLGVESHSAGGQWFQKKTIALKLLPSRPYGNSPRCTGSVYCPVTCI